MSRERGFTLVEVVVALIIVAVGLGAVLTALSSSANNTVALRERTVAQWLALNQLTTTRLATSVPSDGDTEGDVDSYANGRWHWHQTVEDMDVPGVKRVTVQVRRAGTGDSDATEDSWLATVVGFRGDAVARPDGNLPNWSGNAFASANGQNNTGPGGRLRNPGAPQPGVEPGNTEGGTTSPSPGLPTTPPTAPGTPTPPPGPLPTPGIPAD
jgi:general secretion pathway protein I